MNYLQLLFSLFLFNWMHDVSNDCKTCQLPKSYLPTKTYWIAWSWENTSFLLFASAAAEVSAQMEPKLLDLKKTYKAHACKTPTRSKNFLLASLSFSPKDVHLNWFNKGFNSFPPMFNAYAGLCSRYFYWWESGSTLDWQQRWAYI